MKTFKKLSLRLLILVALIGGVFFVHKDIVSAEAECEWTFQECMNSCEQGNGHCYAACYMAYLNCTLPIDN